MSPSERPRIAALDVVRGFALCGVLLANVQPIAAAGAPPVAPPQDGISWHGLLVDQRFYPIFSVLFGIGFALLLRSAGERAARPRLVLLRRLLALLAIGLAHHFLLWQGDILAVYAVAGLVVLLPSTWLPAKAVAWLAAAFLLAALALGGGPFAVVPGLFLLGAALTRYGVIDRIEDSARLPALIGLTCAALAVPVGALQAQQVQPGLTMPLGGLLIAGAYICLLLILLRTPLRPVLQAVFAPLGRMALTNYLTATVLVLAVAPVMDGPPHAWPTVAVLAITGGILLVQWCWSVLWLRRFRQGPLEWVWRWATWARRPALAA
ncbi:DUF418 domain-containing protein [Nonomuraea sp. NPDC052634]|uniref:DUF418 domain-containing protein n=1 Tax=Nonomuraea sp. NPDC052634 TaxID=3155813 RepID=UPI0034317F36